MSDPLLIVPLALWFFICGITTIMRHILAKKLGKHSEYYEAFRQPNFVVNLLNSLVSAGLMVLIINYPVPSHYANFIAVPYFGITAYCLTSAFRVLKEARTEYRLR